MAELPTTAECRQLVLPTPSDAHVGLVCKGLISY